MLTFGNPSSAGVPASVTEHTLVLEYNNPQQLEDAFAQWGDDIACVIVEAVAGNMNMVRGNPEFLRTMRELCTKHGAVLIVDEVMTGFRVAQGGAQAFYGISRPHDARQGDRRWHARCRLRRSPRNHAADRSLGPVYQAGTLSGNPVAVACGLATLKGIQAPGFQDKLSRAPPTASSKGLTAAAQENGITFCADSVGGMFGLYILPSVPHGFADVMKSDTETFNRFFHGMLERGVYFAPSVFEAGFVSIMHTDEVTTRPSPPLARRLLKSPPERRLHKGRSWVPSRPGLPQLRSLRRCGLHLGLRGPRISSRRSTARRSPHPSRASPCGSSPRTNGASRLRPKTFSPWCLSTRRAGTRTGACQATPASRRSSASRRRRTFASRIRASRFPERHNDKGIVELLLRRHPRRLCRSRPRSPASRGTLRGISIHVSYLACKERLHPRRGHGPKSRCPTRLAPKPSADAELVFERHRQRARSGPTSAACAPSTRRTASR